MRLTCPECKTQYRTSAEAVGAKGRTVRCAKCKATWFAPPPDADALALEELAKSPVDVIEEPPTTEMFSPTVAATGAAGGYGAHTLLRDQADAQRMARRKRIIALIWAVPLLILAVAAVLAFIFRQEIVNRNPYVATAYNAIGLPTTIDGLSIDTPTASTALTETGTLLTVRSEVRNTGRKSADLPLIELSLHNPAGERVAQWFVTPRKSRLDAGERLAFTTDYPDPPVDATGLRYRFAD